MKSASQVGECLDRLCGVLAATRPLVPVVTPVRVRTDNESNQPTHLKRLFQERSPLRGDAVLPTMSREDI
jgi:hypothetical protein